MHGFAQLVIGVVLIAWTFFGNLFRRERTRPVNHQSRNAGASVSARRRWVQSHEFSSSTGDRIMADASTDDKAFADQLAARLVADHRAAGMQATPFLDRLSAVFAWLRANGVTWQVILRDAWAVYKIVSAGGSWEAIVAAIAALFGLPLTTPGPAV